MSFVRRLPVPRRFSSRMWLLTVPSALVSFERRQGVPKLPVGKLRYLGVPLIAGGVALAAWAWRKPDAAISTPGPLARFSSKPATLAGVLVLGGAGLLLRSAVLAAYSLGVAVAAGTDAITIEEPSASDLLGSGGD